MVPLIGTDGDDVLYETTAYSTLYGMDGDDTLIGNDGISSLFGGNGDDTLIGGGGNDRLTGGAGVDVLDGGSGIRDAVFYEGENAADAVHVNLATGTGVGGEAEGDVLRNIEVVYGTEFDDTLIGSDQSDVLWGRGGSDLLIGGDGDDFLYGDYLGDTSGDDTVLGGDGNDTLTGRDGNDILIGGDGNDRLSGGADGDILSGGAGMDTLDYNDNGTEGVTINLATGTASGGTADGDVFDGFENVRGSGVADMIIGDEGRNHLDGFYGDDHLRGGDFHDVLTGGGGNDTLEGGDGNDLLTGDGRDAYGAPGSDTFLWTVFEGGAERDRITDFDTGEQGDRFVFGKTFQEKSGIGSFDDFLDHASENETGVYVDFADGRHYGYGVQIDGVTLDELTSGHVVFDDNDDGLPPIDDL
ncbi:calcium-binding protein [Thalassospira lucentensis]|nr:calcium-binding protein [Thalassospira lucentensis]